jgi:hypothetical protein
VPIIAGIEIALYVISKEEWVSYLTKLQADRRSHYK